MSEMPSQMYIYRFIYLRSRRNATRSFILNRSRYLADLTFFPALITN